MSEGTELKEQKRNDIRKKLTTVMVSDKSNKVETILPVINELNFLLNMTISNWF